MTLFWALFFQLRALFHFLKFIVAHAIIILTAYCMRAHKWRHCCFWLFSLLTTCYKKFPFQIVIVTRYPHPHPRHHHHHHHHRAKVRRLVTLTRRFPSHSLCLEVSYGTYWKFLFKGDFVLTLTSREAGAGAWRTVSTSRLFPHTL